MIVNKPSEERRRGFTLIEMLVVVTIIGILAGLITAAALRARTRAKIALIVLEVSELDAACKMFKEKFGEYPPDGSDTAATARFILKAFPRKDPLKPGPPGIDPSTALVFWLGGYPTPPPDSLLNGFSADPADPFNATAAARILPFFDFGTFSRIAGDRTFRLIAKDPNNPLLFYYRPTKEGTPNIGYMYFRAQNRAYSGAGAMKDGRIAAQPWMNPDSFQIRAGGWGQDVTIGPSQLFGVGTGYQTADWDDITNFSGGTLEDAIQ